MRLPLLFCISSLAVVGVVAACGGGDGMKAKLPDGVRSEEIAHEACDESETRKVETVDVNNDGKPDIKRIYENNHEICRISDLNHDGKPDMFEYYDKNGVLRRREADYDDNGVVNSIELYENGKLVRAELDTTNQGKIDTWDTFDPSTGKRTKRERDSNGDGRVDQWWTYDGDKTTIAMDRNGDGLPDPDTVVTLGGNGAPIASATPTAGAPPDAGAPPPPPAAPVATEESAPRAPDGPAMVDAGADGPKRGGAKR